MCLNKRFLNVLIISSVIAINSSCKTDNTENKNNTENSKPNIIYILVDDLGYGDLSCYGQTKFETPNIDKLALKGIKFTQHYSGSSVCAPSRATLLSGMHTGFTHIRGNKEYNPEGQEPMPDTVYTVAEMLKKQGYVTGAFGKWGLGFVGTEGDPNNQGFDEFFGYNCQRQAHRYYPAHLWHNSQKVTLEGNDLTNTVTYAQDVIHEKAMQFIRNNKDTAFFAYIPYVAPHAELIAPNDSILQKFMGKFEEPKPFTAKPGGDYGPDMKIGRYCSQENPRAVFAAMVYRIDVYVGQIMLELNKLGIDKNTIVMFTSDNGPHQEAGADPDFFNSHGGLRGYKRDLYEGGIRVPFVASWPGVIPEGIETDHPSAFWDLMPTLAEITGAELEQTNGVSFYNTLKTGSQDQKHHHLYWEFHELGGRQAVRMGKWKGVRYGVKYKPNKPIELYNLADDPGEQNNVADANPEVAKEIETLMKTSRTPSGIFNFGSTAFKSD